MFHQLDDLLPIYQIQKIRGTQFCSIVFFVKPLVKRHAYFFNKLVLIQKCFMVNKFQEKIHS